MKTSASLGSIPHPNTGRALDALSLDGLSVRCILGLYPTERVRPQSIGLSLTLHVDTGEVAERGDLSLGRLAAAHHVECGACPVTADVVSILVAVDEHTSNDEGQLGPELWAIVDASTTPIRLINAE